MSPRRGRSYQQGGFGTWLETQIAFISLGLFVLFVATQLPKVEGTTITDGLSFIGLVIYSIIWCCFFFGAVGIIFEERIEPRGFAKELLERSTTLALLNSGAWVVLALTCILGTYYGLLQFTNRWIALLGLPMGLGLAAGFVALGWAIWETLGPTPDPNESSEEEVSSEPSLGSSVKAELLAEGRGIKLRPLLNWGPALLTLFALTVAPWTALEHTSGFRASLLGFAGGVLVSFPLYLWGRHFSRRLWGRTLEWIPGSEMLLLHFFAAGRAQVLVLGRTQEIEDLKEEKDHFSFQLNGQTYRFDEAEFARVLGLPQS